MKKRYTRKQILEALHFWRAKLRLVNESKENSFDDFDAQVQSDELDDGSYEESLQPLSREEADSKAEAELKKQAREIGLADGEVICLLLGKLAVISLDTDKVRALTPEEYRRYCEYNARMYPTNESKKKDKNFQKKDKKEDKKEGKAMKKKHTKEEIMEAISHWKGVLESMENEAEEADAGRKQDLDAFADMVYSFIKNSVEKGLWAPEYDGEEVSRENIQKSIPWGMVDATAEEKNYVMDKVYPKLRKNSVFSKMKKAMRGEED